MSNYLDLSINEIHELLKNKTIKPIDLVNETFERIEANDELNAFITLNKDSAIKKAIELENEEIGDNLLFALPIAIKDNICTKGLRTTCASRMLEDFIPTYDAEVIKKIEENKMIIIGKTNMDEFAMGATSRTSYFGAPKNPRDITRIAGGSSGGSASAVAANLSILALGTDTGGSIRQPASYCGIVGMKPTYGRISRYGVVAFASSMDQVGPMSRNVYENALLLNALVGHDSKDLTSSKKETEDFTRLIGEDIKGMKLAIPKFFESDIIDKEILEKFASVKTLLEEKGALVEEVDIKHLEQAVTLFQIIAIGEASSNLARFDGIRYGYKASDANNIDELYKKTRQEGFGAEVKRRMMVGSYILSGENAKIYYEKALKIREEMKNSFKETFKKYDLIIGPTTTSIACRLDEELDDPSKNFTDDILVVPVNLAGLPAISVPMGKTSNNLPIGLHIIGNSFEEAKIYKLAHFIESKFKKEGETHE